jgi:hypothetical protein
MGNHRDLLEVQNYSTHWRQDYVNSGHDECMNYMFWHNTIPNASAVVWRRETLNRVGGAPTDLQVCGDWVTYINALQFSDIAFAAAPLNYFRQHEANVRTRAIRRGNATREPRKIQRMLMKRYGRGKVLRDHEKILPRYVIDLINSARVPPHQKVPAAIALELLVWFAQLHPKAFTSALKTLSWESLAEMARRLGILGAARRLTARKHPAP